MRVRLILCIFILITHLIFKISKENYFDYFHCQTILLISFENDRTISTKFLTHRRVILIILKKARTLN